MSLPGYATEAEREWLIDQAKKVAIPFDGAFYDPQSDAILWPDTSSTKPPSGRRVDVVEFEWYFPPGTTARSILEAFLEHARDLPALLPKRYGSFEPFQHRFAGAGEDFVDFAMSEDSVFWKRTYPVFGGSVFDPARSGPSSRRLQHTPTLSVSVGASSLIIATAFLEMMVDLFLNVACHIPSFYGMACMERDHIYRRSLWPDQHTQHHPKPPGNGWYGLPPLPVWMSWFGPPYADLLEKELGTFADVSSPGRLLRLSEEPIDLDRALELQPVQLSESLTAVLGDLSRTWRNFEADVPAQTIPKLG